MPVLDAAAWAEALTMFYPEKSYILVGPRRHEEWVLDVAAIMRREVTDPRSWKWNDSYEDSQERWEDPYFPFVIPPSDQEGTAAWRARLRPVPRVSVERLIVMLSTLWLNVPDERKHRNFDERQPELEQKARVILSRFPEGTHFYTNSGYPGTHGGWYPEPPDFYKEMSGCDPISQLDWDLGMVAVNDSEVGFIWSFDER